MMKSKGSFLKVKNDLFLSTLGLARRAGKLYYGFDSICENVNDIYTVFIAKDSSERTVKNIAYILYQKNIQCQTINYTKNELGYAIGTKPVGIIGIADSGFTKLLKARISTEVTE